MLTEPEDSVTKKGLNSVATMSIQNDICSRICDVKTASSKRHGVQLEDLNSVGKVKTFDIQYNKDGIQSLKLNKEIRILQAYKRNRIVVLNDSTYKEKLSKLLKSSIYEPHDKDHISQIEERYRNFSPSTNHFFSQM